MPQAVERSRPPSCAETPESRAGKEGARARRLAKGYTLRKKRSEAAESLGCLSEGNFRVTAGDRKAGRFAYIAVFADTPCSPIRRHAELTDFRGGFLSLDVSLAAIKAGDENE
jgi:hypothetical protein